MSDDKALIVSGREIAEPTSPEGLSDKELLSAIAMDIGKDLVAYIEVMYPKALEGMPSTFKLSIRNHTHNQIVAAVEASRGADQKSVLGRLEDRKEFRRQWLKVYRDIRRRRATKEPGKIE